MVDRIITPVSVKGELVEKNKAQYGTVLIPVGENVTVEIKSNGKVIETLGPWVAKADLERNALVQVRVRVQENCMVKSLTKVVIKAPDGR
jgi:hypothetical protein